MPWFLNTFPHQRVHYFLRGKKKANSRDLARKIKMNLDCYGKLLRKKKKKKLMEKHQKDIVVSLKLLPLDRE